MAEAPDDGEADTDNTPDHQQKANRMREDRDVLEIIGAEKGEDDGGRQIEEPRYFFNSNVFWSLSV
jgi:hypothetical protein